jgi:hypothetical protein
MKTAVKVRYFSKFKARHKHYLAGKYRVKKGDEKE